MNTDFNLGMNYLSGRLIHEFVAQHKIPECARVNVVMEPVGVDEEDYDLENFDSTYKYAGKIRFTIEL